MTSKNLWTRRAVLGVGMCLLLSPSLAKDNTDDTPEQGSTPEEIAALRDRPLPQPAKIKVAILPFHDVSGSLAHVHMASAANYLLWQREGFEMIPLLKGFEAAKADKELEPDLPLRRAEAVRLGKAVGADWAVYGEVKELRPYTKTGIFKSAKYLIAGIRINAVDVQSGETVYWHSRNEKTGGTGIGVNRRAATLKRRGAIIASINALKPLFAAFPNHETKGEELDSNQLATFVNDTWPGSDRDD